LNEANPAPDRRRFAFRAAIGYAVVLLVLTALQYFGLKYVFNIHTLPVNVGVVRGFMTLNGVSLVALAVVTGLNLLTGRYWPARADLVFRISAHTFAVGYIPFALAHIHFAGSVSTFLLMLVPSGAFLYVWVLGTRWAWFYLLAGLMGLFALQTTEYLGWLPYAPVFSTGGEVGAQYLRGYYMLSTDVLYSGLSVFMMVTLTWFEREADRRRSESIAAARSLVLSESEIKTLRGLLPLCAHCGKVRDDEGYWQDVATYLHERTDAKVSHGICPDCLRDRYPAVYQQLHS
jgi:hypothetical protein